jgi:two-component sensor histidine kinase
MNRSLSMSIEPEWDEIEKAREKTTRFLEALDFSADDAYAVTMVISELIENSIKYGHFALPGNKVKVGVSVDQNSVTVEVLNPISESAFGHLKRLDRTIQWIRGFQDPFQAYMEKLKEVSRRPLGDEESGLGLVRVAYEGRAILDFFLTEEGELNVSAVSRH